MNSPSTSKPKRLLMCCLLAAVSGYVLFMAPVFFQGKFSSVFALYEAAVKDLSWSQVLLLFAGGFVFRMCVKPPWMFLVGMCFVVSLPLLSVVEMVKDPTSHNLWPFEFAIYAMVAMIPYLGMLSASLLKKLFNRLPLSP